MSKPRYINANDINITGLTFEDVNNEVYFSLSDIRRAIEQTPTADVVEVVRCMDCKYYSEHTYLGHSWGRCDHPNLEFDVECYDHWIDVDPTDFCSHGERKEQE